MSFPSFNDLSAFTSNAAHAIEEFISYLWGWASAQHKDDGSHAAVTADSITTGTLTVNAPSVASQGNVSGNLIPTVDRTYSLGAFSSTAPVVPLTWKDGYFGSHLYLGVTSSGGVPITAWTATLGSAVISWQPALTGQIMQWANASGTPVVSISPDSLLGIYLSSIAGISAGTFVSATSGYKERSRSTALGEWIDVTYNSANFTASSGTWTVDNADQILYRYTLIGQTMILAWELDTTTVSGGQAQLRIAIPGGFVAAKSVTQGGLIYSDNGAAFVSGGNIFTSAGSGFVAMEPGALGAGTWSAATNTTQVRGVFTFEIQ